MASKAYADAQDNLKETQTKAYADGKITDAEARAIADATAKANAAKAYADAQDILLKAQADAYADGKVTAEEQARIDQAQTNLNAAKQHAQQVADQAQQNANNHTDQQVSVLQGLLDVLKQKTGIDALPSGKTIIAGGQIDTDLLNAIAVRALIISAGLITASEIDVQSLFAQYIEAVNLNVTGSSRIGSMQISNGYLYDTSGNGGIAIYGNGTSAAIGSNAAPETLGIPIPAWFESYDSGGDTNIAMYLNARNSFLNKNLAMVVGNGQVALKGVCVGVQVITQANTIINENACLVKITSLNGGTGGNPNVFFPSNPETGRYINVKNASAGGATLQPNGKQILDLGNNAVGATLLYFKQCRSYIFDGSYWVEINTH